jgi:hypothetical protein
MAHSSLRLDVSRPDDRSPFVDFRLLEFLLGFRRLLAWREQAGVAEYRESATESPTKCWFPCTTKRPNVATTSENASMPANAMVENRARAVIVSTSELESARGSWALNV